MNGRIATRQLRPGLPSLVMKSRGRNAVHVVVIVHPQADLLEVVERFIALLPGVAGGSGLSDSFGAGAGMAGMREESVRLRKQIRTRGMTVLLSNGSILARGRVILNFPPRERVSMLASRRQFVTQATPSAAPPWRGFCTRDARAGRPRFRPAPRRQGQAGHPDLLSRRRQPCRHVRLQARAGEAARQADDRQGQGRHVLRPARQPDEVAVRVQAARQVRAGGSATCSRTWPGAWTT